MYLIQVNDGDAHLLLFLQVKPAPEEFDGVFREGVRYEPLAASDPCDADGRLSDMTAHVGQSRDDPLFYKAFRSPAERRAASFDQVCGNPLIAIVLPERFRKQHKRVEEVGK